MNLPFTVAEFFAVFERYNLAIGWSPVVLSTLAALLLVVVALRRWPGAPKAGLWLLAVLWCWNGVAYHALFFAPVNPAALVFAAVFVAQGLLLSGFAVFCRRAAFELHLDWRTLLGGLAVLYALVVYPLWGAALGHGYPQGPIFGVAPCPTTIFTFGVLMVFRPLGAARVLLIAPTLWAIVGTSAALQLGVPQDFGLPLAAVVAWAAVLAPSFAGHKPAAPAAMAP